MRDPTPQSSRPPGSAAAILSAWGNTDEAPALATRIVDIVAWLALLAIAVTAYLTFEDYGLGWDDFDLVAIHQVALPYLPPIFERLGVAPDKSVITIADHGNLASVTLPLQLSIARETELVGPGSLVLLIELAGGISLGLMVVRL